MTVRERVSPACVQREERAWWFKQKLTVQMRLRLHTYHLPVSVSLFQGKRARHTASKDTDGRK